MIDDKILKSSIQDLLSELTNKKYKKKLFILKLEFNYYLSLFYSFFKIIILAFNKKYYKNNIIKKNIFFSSQHKNYHPLSDTYWQNLFRVLNENSYTIFCWIMKTLKAQKKNLKMHIIHQIF